MATLKPTHTDSLAHASRELLARLADRGWTQDFYLAGSAALALYTGHRSVANLDLMTAHNRLTSARRRDLLLDLLVVDDTTKVETARDGYLFARVGEVALKLFYYPYPLVDSTLDLATLSSNQVSSLAVISSLDLGLMKLGAIISRGTRRDFVDLYLLCRHLPLAELLACSADKFGHVRDFPLQALKGLADRSLVIGEPIARHKEELDWEKVEAWLDGQIERLGGQLVEG